MENLNNFNLTESQFNALKPLGNEWEGYGKKRIYLDEENLAEFLGLSVIWRKSRISSASLDNEDLSNSKAMKFFTQCQELFIEITDEAKILKNKKNHHFVFVIEQLEGK